MIPDIDSSDLGITETNLLIILVDLENYLYHKNVFLILHMNIRSLNKNFDSLNLIIKSMQKLPDVVICTETNKIHKINFFNIDNYVMYISTRV